MLDHTLLIQVLDIQLLFNIQSTCTGDPFAQSLATSSNTLHLAITLKRKTKTTPIQYNSTDQNYNYSIKKAPDTMRTQFDRIKRARQVLDTLKEHNVDINEVLNFLRSL